MSALRLAVDALAPEAPFPPDARAKGWKFALDYERIDQSDTWALASAEMRPWLLMLWLTAWRQTPCGSLPAEDELIAARIGMPARTFIANRDILLRGWKFHSDGRLYHPVMTEQVVSMLSSRRKDAERVAEWRAQKNQQLTPNVTRNTDVPTGDYGVSTTPEPVPVPSLKEANASLSSAPAGLPDCPHQKILNLFAKNLPHLSQPRVWEGVRQRNMRQRWREAAAKSGWSDGYTDEAGGLKFWDNFFSYIANETRLPKGFESKGRYWIPDLPWIINASNFQKIVDSKYEF